MRDMLRQALQRRGHTVDEAADGREALRRFEEHQPDVVITDLVMPGMEGIETIQVMHKLHPDLPIIAISGGGRLGPDGYLAIAAQIGAKRTFAKPFRLEDVATAVQELTAGKA